VTDTLVEGAWDAHAHVIGDASRFPLSPGRSYTPEPASLEAYLALLDRVGIAHGVLVQPSVYGFDNRCLIDALERSAGRLFGVAVPAPDATARDLERMHRHGVRAVRCNLINPGGLRPDVVAGWQPALRALGWHVEVQVSIDDLPGLAGMWKRFGVPAVIDHLGRPAPGQTSPERSSLRALIELVRDGVCFVKLSAPYRLSAEPPPWQDVAPLAEALIDASPHACLWGTDWPHVDTRSPVRTDDVLTALGAWCPDATTRQIVSTHAARTLFRG
jgi:predicted TIM-barrel fold metal-dependent hydrolase